MEKIETKEELLALDPRQFQYTILTQEEILRWFGLCNAVWIHNNDPSFPHAELSGGLCSNGFLESQGVLENPNLSEILAHQLIMKLRKVGVKRPDWIISSSYAAITFGYEVARQMGATFGFTTKDCSDPKEKRMLWKRRTIPKESVVLQIEELGTTSSTFREVRRAVEEGNSEPVSFLPTVGMLIHRPPKLPVDYGEYKVVALVEKEIWAVDPAKCSLCEAGSKRYRPKTHWKELTGK
ncbi:MAG: hypothetical protein WA063_03275 [Minisyncoccia bacterium]